MRSSCFLPPNDSLGHRERRVNWFAAFGTPGNTALVLTMGWAQTEARFISEEKRVPMKVHIRQMDKLNLSESRGFPGQGLAGARGTESLCTGLVYPGIGHHVPSFHSSEANEHR